MDDAEDAGHREARSGEALPERDVTVNMIVAYNVAYFRKAAGLTQDQLGERLGMSKVAVSAAERSWDGKRIRQFDADLIAELAQALDIPIAALFLPPEDDDISCVYAVYSGREPDEQVPMGTLFAYVTPDPPDEDTPAVKAYERRLITAMGKYYDSAAAEELARRLRELANEEQFASALRAARANRETLLEFTNVLEEVLGDNYLLQDILTKALRATPEGRALIDEAWQVALVQIGKDMFGERGPTNRSEMDRVIEAAHRRGIKESGAAVVMLRDDGTYELVRPADTPVENGQT